MEEQKYLSIAAYVQHGVLPEIFPSTKANFIRMAGQFTVNSLGRLMFQQKIVVLQQETQNLFDTMHSHSGRTACWKRIKAR